MMERMMRMVKGAGPTRRRVLAVGALALAGGAAAVTLRGADLRPLPRLGFAAATRGGDGGRIVPVTTLDEDGPGSLREALERTLGPRIIHFEIFGKIRLSREIRIRHPRVTLDGATAPGDGVTVSGARLRVETQEVIISGMQLRPGEDPDGDTPNQRDALSIGNGARDVLVVGNSLTWAIDENVSLWGAMRNVTLAYNIVGEALRDSIHVDENATEPAPHSMGMIIGSSHSDALPERVTIARNLFVSNEYRNPYLKTGRDIEIVDNLIVNHGAGHQAMSIGDGQSPCVALVTGNVFRPGPDTRPDRRPPVDLRGLPSGSRLFLAGNVIEPCDARGCAPVAHGRLDRLSARPDFAASTATDQPLTDLPGHIIEWAGARDLKGMRRPVDANLIRALREGRSRIIDHTSESAGLG